MKAFNIKTLTKIALFVSILSSCVPASKLDDMTARKDKCEDQIGNLKAQNLELSTMNDELKGSVSDLTKAVKGLERDTAESGSAYRRMTGMYKELNESYDRLIANNEKLLASNADETKKALLMMQNAQAELFRKEDSLQLRERDLNELNNQLKLREAKLYELQALVNRNDSAMNALKANLTQALIGYKDKGITVEEKNGMIYVSLEEKLLFASGSTVVDKTGAVALKDLAQALEKNKDINILIEGHTDNVPISGGPIKDNWDLSVLRATSVVRILMRDSKINPVNLTPAGKGEYMPLDTGNSADSRRKNRRIEVIIIPKIAELLNLVKQ